MSRSSSMQNPQGAVSPGAAAGAPAPGDTLNLMPMLIQYWQGLVRWRYVAAGIVAACLAIGIVATLLMAPRYTARAQIEISREQKNVTNVEGLESSQEGRDQEFYATQYALLKAESLADRIVRKHDLAKADEFFKAHGVKPGDDRERQAAGLLRANVEIASIRMSRLVDINYTSRSPALSAKIANAWVQEFIGETMDRQFASTAEARKFLEGRLDALRERLEQSEREVVTYATSRDIVTLDSARDADGRTFSQRTLASTDLEALNQALATARAERIAAQSKAGSAVDNTPEVLTNPAIVSLRAKRAEYAAEYANLMVKFEPGYPAARALQQQIASLDSALARETARIAGSRRQAYSEALAREKALEGRVAQLKGQLGAQRQDTVQYNIYQREADTNRQLYDALLQRYKEIGVAGSVGASNIAVVDRAKVPAAPSSPNLPLNIALSLMAGLVLAGFAVLALEQIDEGVRSPDEVGKLLHLPVLGNIPLTQGAPLNEIDDARSMIAEAYFSVRSTLAFATSHGLPRSFAIVSTGMGEGKSTTALALAEVIGRSGKRVLLVDADLRSPSQHGMLGVPNQAGLSNLLAGEELVPGLIRETRHKGVFVLTSGPIPPSPAELLSSERLTELIKQWGVDFDHVVIDSPPVLGLADAPLAGRATEGIVFVIEAEKTPRRAMQAAVQRLRSVGNHIFGVVVTKIDFSKHSFGYGYGYGYGYGSRYGDETAEAEAPVRS